MPNGSTLETLIAERTQHFTGREWVFEQIDAWLEKDDNSVFFLTGEPGSGKTAVAARLVQISSSAVSAPNTSHLANQPLAYYFFCQTGSEELDPLRFVTNLALAHAKRFDKYAQALANLGDQQNIYVQQSAGQINDGGQLTGVAIKSLTITDLSARVAFNRTIREPLLDLYQKGLDSPIIILIDALDEALTYHKEENLVTLLAQLLDKPQELPPNMRFILTGRPDERLLHRLPPPTLDLIDGAPDDLDDVRRYAQNRLRELTAEQRAALAERIAVTGKGNFLYARYVLDDLLPRLSPDTDVSILPLPETLKEIYQEFLDRELANTTEDWQEKYGLLVSILAVSRGDGLTRDQLAGMVDLEDKEADRILTPIQQYLSYQTLDGPYRIYHQSFREFLLSLEEGPIRTYPHQAHSTIATYFLEEWEGYWDDCDELYSLQHLPFHMQQAGAGAKTRRSRREWVDRLRVLLMDFGWLRAKLAGADVNSLLNDFSLLDIEDRQDPLRLVEGALRLSAHVLAKDKEQLSSQLYGRLLSLTQPEIVSFREHIADQISHPWLKPQVLSLIPPGGPLVRTLHAHKSPISDVAILSNAPMAISADHDGAIKIWDLDSGILVRKIEGHRDVVSAIGLPKDGHWLLSASWDKTVKIWELSTGLLMGSFKEHTAEVQGVCTALNGQIAVSCDSNGVVKVWLTRSFEELHSWKAHEQRIWSVQVTPDDQYIVTSSEDGSAKVWELESGKLVQVLMGEDSPRLFDIRPGVKGSCVTPSNEEVLTWMNDLVYIWVISSGQLISSLEGQRSGITDASIDGAGRRLVIGRFDGTLSLWDLDARKTLRTIEAHSDWINAVAITPDGNHALTGGRDHLLKYWDLTKEQIEASYRVHGGGIRDISIMPDGLRALSASHDGSIYIWDLIHQKPLRALEGHRDTVWSISLSEDGSVLVSRSEDRTIRVWNMETYQELSRIDIAAYGGQAVCISRDGQFILFDVAGGRIQIWDRALEKSVQILDGHNGGVRAICISPCSRYVVSASEDTTLKVWDLQTHAAHKLGEHDDSVVDLAMSQDGKMIASASLDGSVKVWNWRSGELAKTLGSHSGFVETVAWFSDNKRLISGSYDHTLKVWDVEKEQVIAAFSGDGGFYGCDVSRDGRNIVAGDDIGWVHFLKWCE